MGLFGVVLVGFFARSLSATHSILGTSGLRYQPQGARDRPNRWPFSSGEEGEASAAWQHGLTSKLAYAQPFGFRLLVLACG